MGQQTFAQRLCEILVKQEVIHEDESLAMQKAFKDSEKSQFDDFLLEEGLIEEDDLLRALSELFNVPSFDVTGYFFDPHLLHMFPKGFLLRNAIVPLEVDENIMIVVAAQPTLPGLESSMREFVSYDITFLVGIRLDICDAVKEFYDAPVTEDIPTDVDLRVEHMQDKEAEEIEAGDIDDIAKSRY